MVFNLTDNLEKFMTQYTLKIETDSISEGLVCVICSKIVVDAYQSYCGCKYCRKCIIAHLANGDTYCCGNMAECQEEHLVLDKNVSKSAMINKKILKTRVHCPNEYCSHIEEIYKMEEHLRECDTGKSNTNAILNHLRDGSLTHSQLLFDLIHTLKNEVKGQKDYIEASNVETSKFQEELRMKDVRMEDLKRNMDKQETELENKIKETNDLKLVIKRLNDESNKKKLYISQSTRLFKCQTWKICTRGSHDRPEICLLAMEAYYRFKQVLCCPFCGSSVQTDDFISWANMHGEHAGRFTTSKKTIAGNIVPWTPFELIKLEPRTSTAADPSPSTSNHTEANIVTELKEKYEVLEKIVKGQCEKMTALQEDLNKERFTRFKNDNTLKTGLETLVKGCVILKRNCENRDLHTTETLVGENAETSLNATSLNETSEDEDAGSSSNAASLTEISEDEDALTSSNAASLTEILEDEDAGTSSNAASLTDTSEDEDSGTASRAKKIKLENVLRTGGQ